MTAYLGDYVETLNTGFRGRVTDVHFGCPESSTWLSLQQSLGPNPMEFQNVRWLSVLVHGGGSIAIPDDPQFIMHVEPFDLDNVWADEYFRESVKEDA
jgi:hypothetical protein